VWNLCVKWRERVCVESVCEVERERVCVESVCANWREREGKRMTHRLKPMLLLSHNMTLSHTALC